MKHLLDVYIRLRRRFVQNMGAVCSVKSVIFVSDVVFGANPAAAPFLFDPSASFRFLYAWMSKVDPSIENRYADPSRRFYP